MNGKNHKLIVDVNDSDFRDSPVWYFPMDESIEDGELVIKPLREIVGSADNYQVVVRANFTDRAGERHPGYIYWYSEGDLANFQPCVFIEGGKKLYFWHGIKVPEVEQINLLKRLDLPVSFESEVHLGLKVISGSLNGLYYYDDSYDIAVVSGD